MPFAFTFCVPRDCCAMGEYPDIVKNGTAVVSLRLLSGAERQHRYSDVRDQAGSSLALWQACHELLRKGALVEREPNAYAGGRRMAKKIGIGVLALLLVGFLAGAIWVRSVFGQDAVRVALAS